MSRYLILMCDQGDLNFGTDKNIKKRIGYWSCLWSVQVMFQQKLGRKNAKIRTFM